MACTQLFYSPDSSRRSSDKPIYPPAPSHFDSRWDQNKALIASGSSTIWTDHALEWYFRMDYRCRQDPDNRHVISLKDNFYPRMIFCLFYRFFPAQVWEFKFYFFYYHAMT